MAASLLALDEALAPRWTRLTPWIAAGDRLSARAVDVRSQEPLCLTAVRCDAEGMATASLAREISALEYLSHQPSVLPLHGAGRQHGWLFAATPCTQGTTLADRLAREGSMEPEEVLEVLIAIADLLHFMHGAGLAHAAITPATLVEHGGTVRLGGFGHSLRVQGLPDQLACCAADVYLLAQAGRTLLSGSADPDVSCWPDERARGLSEVLRRATSRHADERFQTAIAFAQALCVVRDAMSGLPEVAAREAAEDVEALQPISDGVERSLSVLHALLDRAEVEEVPPEPGDPLVHRCWERAIRQLAPGDARLVALRVRWRLLADRDPAGALTASMPAQGAAAVWPYRARALAALGRAAEARALAVRTWFEEVVLDVPALRSLTMALVLTRAFELATLVSVTDAAAADSDPVIRAARASRHGGAASMRGTPLQAIATAIDRRIPWTAELLVDPRWDAMRGDPDFATLVGRVCAQWSVA